VREDRSSARARDREERENEVSGGRQKTSQGEENTAGQKVSNKLYRLADLRVSVICSFKSLTPLFALVVWGAL